MIRNEESKRLWNIAEVARDWQTMDAIEAQWSQQAEPDEQYIWEGGEDDSEIASNPDWDDDWNQENSWTAEDEAGLEEYEETKRRRIAEANEY